MLAPNPGPFTLEGTNTWIVGRETTLVIDPGPDEEAHLADVARAAGRVEAILLTHHHTDHAPGAGRLAVLSGAPVLAFDPGPGEGQLGDGDIVRVAGASLRAVHSPGHTPDHLVFLDQQSRAMFTGDAVLGRGTSVVDPPEGDLAAYIESLRRMLALSPGRLYPGHGPVVPDGMGKLEEYLAHRAERERQVLSGLEAGWKSPAELVPSIYVDYPPELYPVAARSVLAHLIKLEAEGRVVRAAGSEEPRFRSVSPGPGSGPGNPVTR